MVITMPTVLRVTFIVSVVFFMSIVGSSIGKPFGDVVQFLTAAAGSLFGLFIVLILLNITDFLHVLVNRR